VNDKYSGNFGVFQKTPIFVDTVKKHKKGQTTPLVETV